ncbi:MAG: PPC domain-containing protein [Chloroflexi bacterium]|nr:PPC domain-containing protein [Chloroflexota bacterium]
MKKSIIVSTLLAIFLSLVQAASVLQGGTEFQVETPTPTLTPTPRAAEGGAIAPGQSVSGLISPVRQDLWSFTGAVGQLVIITMEATSGSLDPYLELLDPTGVKEASDLDTGPGINARIAKRLAKNGVYTIVARDVQGKTSGGYVLRLTDPAHMPTLPFGPSVNGTINSLGFSDFYTFPGTAGQNVIITMDAAPGSTLDPYLELLTPDGSLEASGTPGSTSPSETLAKVLNNTGAYILIVSDWWATTKGAYTIGLISPTGATPTPAATATPTATPTPTPGPKTVAEALASIAGKYTMVWNFDNATGAWKFYNAANPGGATIARLETWKAYWINMTEEGTLTVGGTSIPLFKGWNLVGWAG